MANTRSERGSSERVHWFQRARAFWPSGSIIKREMQVMARQWNLYFLRMFGAGIGIATLILLVVDMEVGPGRAFGVRIFSGLNLGMLLGILAVGPLLTADTIAEEKREGTLGLLFLTPLSSWEIVLSKFFAQALKGFSFVLAVFPLMALPIVFGGVTWQMVFFAIAGHISALFLALSAGMVASTLRRGWVEAAVTAELICGGMVLLVFVLRLHPATLSVLAVVGTFLALRFCAMELKKRWETEASSYKAPVWVLIFSDSAFWREFFKWDKRKTLDRNPVAWLQEYSWSARLAKWGWLAFACWSVLFVMWRTGHLLFGSIVVLGLCLSAVLSFREERETGALELLLVTPLRPGQIIFGRLWGVWVHFFPPLAILQIPWIAPSILRLETDYLIWFLSSYIFLPALGLMFSLLRLNLLIAWAAVFLLGFFLPYQAVHRMSVPGIGWEGAIWVGIAFQAALGLAALAITFWGFKTRKLIMPRSAPRLG
jgi:ABC-type transport system involved in multi-copper enzyme maturation permease subunit